jgi:hypothetical protein
VFPLGRPSLPWLLLLSIGAKKIVAFKPKRTSNIARGRTALACEIERIELPRRGVVIRVRTKGPDPPSPICFCPGCSTPATIIHHGSPYCGKHALAKLEAGEQPDRIEEARGTVRPLSPFEALEASFALVR